MLRLLDKEVDWIESQKLIAINVWRSVSFVLLDMLQAKERERERERVS